MTTVEVTVRGNKHSFDLDEARALVRHLPGAIDEAEKQARVKPPSLDDGWLTRESLVTLFEQLYSPGRQTNTVVGRLLGRLVSSASKSGSETSPSRRGVPFNIIHVACGQHVREPNCSLNGLRSMPHNYTYAGSKDYRVEAQSLKDFADRFANQTGHHHFGKGTVHDLSILLQHL